MSVRDCRTSISLECPVEDCFIRDSFCPMIEKHFQTIIMDSTTILDGHLRDPRSIILISWNLDSSIAKSLSFVRNLIHINES